MDVHVVNENVGVMTHWYNWGFWDIDYCVNDFVNRLIDRLGHKCDDFITCRKYLMWIIATIYIVRFFPMAIL